MKKKEDAATMTKVDQGFISAEASKLMLEMEKGLAKLRAWHPAGKLTTAAKTWCREQLDETYRIHNFMKSLELKFNADTTLKLCDLMGPADGLLLLMLRRSFGEPNMVYSDDCKQIFWKSSKKYASENFMFAINDDTSLHYDDKGHLYSPFEAMENPSLAQACGLDPHYRAFRAYLVNYKSTRDGQFTIWPATSYSGAALYFEIEWGGANSATSGMSQADLEYTAPFRLGFGTVASKGGKDGVDYCLIDLDALTTELPRRNEVMAILMDEQQQLAARREMMEELFQHKRLLIDEYQAKIDEVLNASDEAERKLNALIARCQANPITQYHFVSIPEINPDEVNIIDRLSFDMSMEDILSIIDKLKEAPKAIQHKLAMAQIVVQRWEEFAPQFVLLRDEIRQVNATLQVGGTEATISFSSPTQLGMKMKLVVDYDALQLVEFTEWLDERTLAYAKARKLITEGKEKLLKALKNG